MVLNPLLLNLKKKEKKKRKWEIVISCLGLMCYSLND